MSTYVCRFLFLFLSIFLQQFREQAVPGGYVLRPTCTGCAVGMSVKAASVFEFSTQAFVSFYFPTLRHTVSRTCGPYSGTLTRQTLDFMVGR